MYDTILVPTDGSDRSLRAAGEAIGVAADGATIHALGVVEDLPLYRQSGKGAKLEAVDDTAARARLEDATEHIGALAADAGLAHETAVTKGVPHREIVGYAEDHGVDAIVMSKRGIDAAAEDLLGSTTERVIRRSPIVVVTVPA